MTLDELADGLLLGDASIHKWNGIFSFAQAGEHRIGFPETIRDLLEDFGQRPRWNAKTRKDGTFVATTWCGSSKFWWGERRRFYPEGIKIIPRDILVSPTSMMLFYLCDGSLGWAHGEPWSTGSSPWVELATCDFTVNDIDMLATIMMKSMGIERYYVKTPHHYPKLCIGTREGVQAFMSYITTALAIPKSYENKFRGFI